MPPDPPKVKKWGKADEKILFDHIRTGAVDIEDHSLANIERVRAAYFSHRTSENFRRNFREYAARLKLEESIHGARRRAAEEGKSRVCLPLVYCRMIIIYLPYVSPRPLNTTGVEEVPPPADNDVIDDEVEVEVDESDENNEEMPPKTKPAAKSSEVTEITPSAARKPKAEKPFLLDVHDGYVVVYYTEDGLDYAEVEIIVQGVLPANGYRFEVRPDGMAVTWMRAFHRVCYTKDHLRHTMGSSFSLSNNRVTAYDNVTEAMTKAKVTPDASNLYWGEPQAVPLKSKCTGTPKITELRFATGATAIRNGKTHMQFSTIYYCRVLLSEQRSSNTAAVTTRRSTSSTRGSTPKNVIFSNSLWTNSEYPNSLKNMFIWSL